MSRSKKKKPRNAPVVVYLQTHEKEGLRDMADEYDLTMSDYMRKLLLENISWKETSVQEISS